MSEPHIVLKKVPAIEFKWLIPIIASAMLWWLSTFFVTQKEYGKDQNDLKVMIQEVRTDVKDLLKRKP